MTVAFATPTATCPPWCVDHTPAPPIPTGDGRMTLGMRQHENTLTTLNAESADSPNRVTVGLRIERADDPTDGWTQTQIVLTVTEDDAWLTAALDPDDLRTLAAALLAAADLTDTRVTA
jgi:hypothetical protein